MVSRTHDQSPRDILEAKECEEPNDFDELSVAFARFLQWLADAGKPESIGMRALVAIYKLRPDLINGEGQRAIAARTGRARGTISNTVSEFSEVFPVQFRTSCPSRSHGSDNRSNAKGARSSGNSTCAVTPHPMAISKPWIGTHVSVVNHFNRWRTQYRDKERTGVVTSDYRRQMLADLKPISDFLRELERSAGEPATRQSVRAATI